MNIYVNAGQEWNDCIQDFGCDIDSLDLSGKWERASLVLLPVTGEF
jgi:hypothetical protein